MDKTRIGYINRSTKRDSWVELVAKLARRVWGNLVSIYFEGGTGRSHWSLRGSPFLRHSGANKPPQPIPSMQYHTDGRRSPSNNSGSLYQPAKCCDNERHQLKPSVAWLITFKSTAHARDKDSWAPGDNLVGGGCGNNHRNKLSPEHDDCIEGEAT